MTQWTFGLSNFRQWEQQLVDQGKSPRDILGGKGLGLAEMASLGLPVPPGFVVSTEACNRYLQNPASLDGEIWESIHLSLKELEVETGKAFGDPENPLLVSCRSGARMSMPGMMDTVLNLGLNPEVVEGLARTSGNQAFAYDLYRRLIQMFASVVMKVEDTLFEDILGRRRKSARVRSEAEWAGDQWPEICGEFLDLYQDKTGKPFPRDPEEQIKLSVEAVFKSWNGKRAVDYRNASGIPHDWGTAVNLVTMVFGNRDRNSATGVCFTRNPDNGEKRLYGDFLINAQGEDVVAGIRNTLPIAQLERYFPNLYQEFNNICARLENHYRDMQDIEFTIEQGKLWILQTRSGKRTAQAAIKIAVDQAGEELISRETALLRISPGQIDTLLHPTFPASARENAIASDRCFARGVNASPGAAVGQAVFDADTAEKWGNEGKAVIMIRPFTRPDDIHGMLAAKGILTAEGGATSHAAVVARQFGVPCVVGASGLDIDLERKELRAQGLHLKEGDTVSIDGSTGECFAGTLPTSRPDVAEKAELTTLLAWADKIRRLEVWANADHPEDANKAVACGAQGIGLCRTEHMFFNPERLPIVQRMILTGGVSEKDECLARLLEFQRDDFTRLFIAMDGKPIIIRLIDPPLHEFIPDKDETLLEVHDLSQKGDSTRLKEKKALLKAIESMHESNPMMGLRGVRLSIVRSEIVNMQVRAIFEAACTVLAQDIPVHPKVMIPLVGDPNELKAIQPQLKQVAAEVMEENGQDIPYQFGTMIELPRACLVADELAETAQFMSFGTNDLTQMTYGFSRDDAESGFLLEYLKRGILKDNPFRTLDQKGVGCLIETAVKAARRVNPRLQIGVCGEHGGDPASIRFFDKAGLDYVSCSPPRIPVARLAAAQATLQNQ